MRELILWKIDSSFVPMEEPHWEGKRGQTKKRREAM